MEPANNPNPGSNELSPLPGKPAITEDKVLSSHRQDEVVARLLDAYIGALRAGTFVLEPPLPLSGVINTIGSSRHTFPLPGGGHLPNCCGLGFGKNIENPRLIKTINDPFERGVWIVLEADSGEADDHETVRSYVLLDKDKGGRDALLKICSKTQYEIDRAYNIALLNGVFTPEPALPLSGLIDKYGISSARFLLPGGGHLPQGCGFGLKKNIEDPRLIKVVNDPFKRGVWILLEADKGEGDNLETVKNYVLLDKEKDGRDALLKIYSETQYEMDRAYNFALLNGVFTPEPALPLSGVIDKVGVSRLSFLLPGGGHLPPNCGLGLKANLENPRLIKAINDPFKRGVWIVLEADSGEVDDHETVRSYVLLDKEKDGRDALLKIYSETQYEMDRAYNFALLNGVFTPDPALPLSGVINKGGASRSSFLLPGGGHLPYNCGIGLGINIENPRLIKTINDPFKRGVWIVLEADSGQGDDRKTVRSYVLLDKDKDGKDALLKICSETQYEMDRAYNFAKRDGVFTPEQPISLSVVINKIGVSQKSFVLPGGGHLPQCCGLGLGKISEPTLKEILYLEAGVYRMHLCGTKPDDSIKESYILLNEDGIIEPSKDVYELAQIEKGNCFDRYLTHLAAVAKLNGRSHQIYDGSVLTNSYYQPNITLDSPKTIVHGKWGLDPNDSFSYLLKYIRLTKWQGMTHDIDLVIANNKFQETLKAEAEKAAVHFKSRVRVLTTIEWANSIKLSIDQKVIRTEIERIETLAAWGLVEQLRAKTYAPTLAHGAGISSSKAAESMKERIERLLAAEAIDGLMTDLDTQIQHFSPYWERHYHIELAAHCGLLFERIASVADLSTANRDSLHEKIIKLYPVLKDYPGAWRVLLESEDGANSTSDGGESERGSLFRAFDLRAELESRMMLKRVDTQTSSALAQTWIGPTPDSILESVKDISDPIEYIDVVNKQLQGIESQEARERLKIEAVRRFIVSALSVEQAGSIQSEIDELKSSHSQVSDFIGLLSRIEPNLTITYQGQSERSAISVAELKQRLARFDSSASGC